mmetsp:Transcript_36535/g.97614  ORF Transcript_36535/g.97614 Transcript_36535/m.97614 type:complete len:421 (+) Transcript_36535:65-1327(+)|eukprot:CAMPEP_0119467502 /NCGR_PEP_ID=MMETSP1344-20130328/1650_1 /TAXON_ID=236787 /ORGANISM="Florenciella parvula, Strain CCMP2471" /LENGTH=420 /DNA_ID=CAMNT_0007499873 /DNA_START=124 /DNA_END=1386 /DNA_ORIENTATION=+
MGRTSYGTQGEDEMTPSAKGSGMPFFSMGLGAAILMGAGVGYLSVHDTGANLRAGSSITEEAQTAQTSTASLATTLDTDDADYFTCPPGDYLGHTDADKAIQKARLQKLQTTLASYGYQKNSRESTTYQTRGYATYESQAWLKPEECSTLVDEAWDATSNGYYQYKNDDVPDSVTKMVSSSYPFEFHLNWKVASTSFPGYLWCEYGTFTSVDTDTDVSSGYSTVAAVRNPVKRFLSAMGEELERSVNYYCPSGYCTFDNDYWQGDTTLDKYSHQTTWFKYVSDSHESGVDMSLLPKIISAFVHDVKCNYYTYASEHFTTQADFVTQNSGEAADLDLVMQLEDVDSGFTELATLLGHTESGNCDLSDSNTADDKPGGIPSENEMMEVLSGDDDLMREICLMYAQDFICFDYDLPSACEGLF